jgi:hypothetical protein
MSRQRGSACPHCRLKNKLDKTRRLQDRVNEAYAEGSTPDEIELLRSIKRK